MKRTLLSHLLVAALAAGGLWHARGRYDEVFLDEGVFHVVNASAARRSIELAFPSGERRSAEFQAGQSVDFHVPGTGEGAVAVAADGERVGEVGYVTSRNGLVVVVVQSDGALFSQYLRSRGPVP